MGSFARRGAVVAALLAAGGALAWAGPPMEGISGGRASVAEWTARPADSQLAALAGLAGWLLLGWLVVAALLTAAAGLPGFGGAFGRVLARRVAPAVVRRVVEAALGLAVAAAVATPTAALAAAPAVHRPAGIERSARTTERAPSQLGDRVFTVAVPAPIAVMHGAQRPGPAPVDAVVVVHRGDSLWSIASRELGPAATRAEIDARWRRWYAANRGAIGADPDLISPGTRLLRPAANTAR